MGGGGNGTVALLSYGHFICITEHMAGGFLAGERKTVITATHLCLL